MISLKKNPSPELKVCPMHCDVKLHEKLDDYELTKFLNTHSTNLLLGRMGSGKTNLLYSFFKSKRLLNKVFEKIIIFQPASSRASMRDKIFEQLPDAQKFDEMTLANLESAESQFDEDGNNCLLIDDMGASLKNKDIKKKLKEMIMNRRHKHLTIWFLCQTWFSIEKDIRKLFSNLFIFKVSKKELETIFDEIIERDKELVLPISKLVYDKPYQFLFVNVDTGRMFKNFDEILIDD